MSDNLSYKAPLAKPSGVTLATHTADVMAEGLDLCQKMPVSVLKYGNIVHKSLQVRLQAVAEYHDCGKKERRWQDACVKDYNEFLKWSKENDDANFFTYSKSVLKEAGRNLRRSGIRHELYSLVEARNVKMPMPLLVAIAAHHGKLCYGAENRWHDFKEFWNDFKKTSNEISERDSLYETCRYVYEYNGVRGLLQLADHRASALEEHETTAEIGIFSYNFPFSKKRGIQELVESEWKKDLLLVRAPTGAGKTDAALLWASKQINARKADRLVIAMPTRFTANALAINVAESLSANGVYHSSAWYGKYKDVTEGNISFERALVSHKMARLLATPVTVTTIDHLLMSLTQTREDHHLINFNLANSCLVIDEADFYDDFTLANIQALLKILKMWYVPVLIMSASIPDSALPFYKETNYNVDSILEDKYEDMSVEKFEIKQLCTYEEISEIEPLLLKCLRRGNGIIYVNTVDKAIATYEFLKRIKEENNYEVPIILYHSRFIEPDKAKKEQQLLRALGKEAWRNEMACGIAVLTQIGEVSINISSDIMISDICPIDRLIQRVGRLCRFNKRKGELYVVKPMKRGVLYPAPYGNYKLKQWKASVALLKTIENIHEGNYSGKDILDFLNCVYSSTIQLSTKAKENARILQEMFCNNWLINPAEQHGEEDSSTDLWKSRDIGPQDVVFTDKPSLYYPNFSAFMNFQLENSIAIPLYLFELIKNKISPHKIYIADLERTIYVVREGFYNDEIGLKSKEDTDDNFL